MINYVSLLIVIFAIIDIVLIILTFIYLYSKEDDNTTLFLFKCFLVSSAIYLLLIIWKDDFAKWIKYKKEIECKEYKIETMVTTKDNISDTTYVIKYK